MKKDKKYIEKIITLPYISCESIYFNDVVRTHWHDKYELEFFDSGSGIAKINNTEFEVKKGVGYFILPPDTHEYTPITSAKVYTLSFPQHIIENKDLKFFFEKNESIIFQLNDDELEWFKILWKRIKYEIESTLPFSQINAVNLLESLLISIARKNEKVYVKSNYPAQIHNALSYIHAHFTENISLSDVAASLFISNEHFSRVFRQYTDSTFSEYLLSVRLNHAKRLLTSTQLSITQIAESSGFNYNSYFSKAFKNYYGETPAEYRKKIKDSTGI